MAQDADAVMIAGDGDIFTAPVGTALPTNPTVALDAAFIGAGYISEDGVTFRDEKTKEPINVWQSFYPVKYRVTESNAELEMILKQWDLVTVPLAFGGGSIIDNTTYFEYSPPAPDVIDERACVLDWTYDTFAFRLVIPRTMVRGSIETQLARASESDLPLTLGILGTPGVDPWTLYTSHPSFDPSA